MRRSFKKEVFNLKENGKAVLLSSHILSEVEKMCDNIGIIRNGEIVETGSLAQMRHLTRTTIKVQTQIQTPELLSMPGVHNVELGNNQTVLSVDSDYLESVMVYLSQKQIVSIQATPPTLEDLFLRYYDSNNGGSNNEK